MSIILFSGATEEAFWDATKYDWDELIDSLVQDGLLTDTEQDGTSVAKKRLWLANSCRDQAKHKNIYILLCVFEKRDV